MDVCVYLRVRLYICICVRACVRACVCVCVCVCAFLVWGLSLSCVLLLFMHIFFLVLVLANLVHFSLYI